MTACTTGKSRWKIELIINWPSPGQGEDLLDHERRADQERDVDSEHGDHRDHRVSEGVPHEHAPLWKPLRARSYDVVGLEDLEQARPQAADEDRRDGDRDGEGGEEHGVEVSEEPLSVAPDRERASEVQCEREQQHDPDPERREAEADERDGADDMVGRPIPPGRGDRCKRYRDHDREQGPEPDEPEGDGQALDDEATGRDAVEERRAQIPVHETGEKAPVLGRQRLVEPPFLMEKGDALRGRPRAEHRPRRVARDEMDEEEDEEGDPEGNRDHVQQAPGSVAGEAHLFMPSGSASIYSI